MLRCVRGLVLAGLAFACVGLVAPAGEGKKPRYTIKQVMAKAMKGGLCGKVAAGKASDGEKEELVALFTALGENKPPRGDAGSWKEKTSALVEAARASDAARLKSAAKCMSCHLAHKGK